MVKNRASKKISLIVAVLIFVPFILFGVAIYGSVSQTSNNKLFWDMVAQNLQTSSVTRIVSQSSEGIEITEKTELQYRAQLVARKTSIVTRKDTTSSSSVTTESIGTVSNDYIRYTKLFSSYHGGLENQLNKWADNADQATKQPATLKDALFSTPLIFGYVSNQQQQTLLSQLHDHNVYTISSDTIQKIKTASGAVAYEIPVTVNWNEYTIVYKQYLAMIGLNVLGKSIEVPEQPITYDFVLSIQPNNKHVVSLRLAEPYITEQIYDNYDSTLSIEIPTKTELSGAELQALVQEQVR